MNDMKKWILEYKVIAILRGIPYDIVLHYAKAAYNGGIRLFEVALNSEDAFREMDLLSRSLPSDALIGAGTAVDPGLAEHALFSGARFLLTPSANAPLLNYCRSNGIPLLPGVMTPSDVDLCLSYGYSTLKLFPASDLPLGYIKSLKGPFDKTDYVAVGGVTTENLKEFMDAGFIGAGIGSHLISKEYVQNGQWEQASRKIAQAISAIS